MRSRALSAWAVAVLVSAAGAWAAPPLEEEPMAISGADFEQLDELVSRLLDPTKPDRPDAIHALIDLTSQFRRTPPEIEILIRALQADPDPNLASQAVAWVTNVDRRRRGDPAPWTEEREADFTRSLREVEQALERPEPMARRNALVGLVHLALSEGQSEESRVRGLLESALADGDQRVRSFAELAMRGLDGEERALHEVQGKPLDSELE